MSGGQNGENLFPSVKTVSVHVRGGGGRGEGNGDGEREGEGDEQVLYSTLSSSPPLPCTKLHLPWN